MTRETHDALKHVVIYTDGAAEPNPGPGGYGVVLQYGKHRKEFSAGYEKTTNNRMELLAVIAGLEALTTRCRVTLYSDSKYVVDSVNDGSVFKWRDRGWWRTRKDPAKNIDLWLRLLDVYPKHEVSLAWVKGHAGVPDNERCDQLATAALQSANREVDTGYMRPKDPTPKRPEEGQHPLTGKKKHKKEGEPCRKCNTPLVKRIPKRKRNPKQTYYFEWYLYCPNCRSMFMVEEAKRTIKCDSDRTLNLDAS